MNGARSTATLSVTASPVERVPPGPFTALAARLSDLLRADIPSVQRTDRLAAAATLMHRLRVPALAVMDDRCLAGIISERDVVRAVAEGLSTDLLCVGDYMSPAPGTAQAADSALSAVRRMIEHGVRHLPVVSAGQVTGVISAGDLLAGLGVPAELIGP